MKTLEQWEAEKARIDDLRAAYIEGYHRGAFVASSPYPTEGTMFVDAEKRFPYPPKPEKTVTLSTGMTVRRAPDVKRIEGYDFEVSRVSTLGGTAWIVAGDLKVKTAADVRLLASLLPENEER